MTRLPLLSLLLCLGLSLGAPVDDGPRDASCTDPVVLGAANEAMDKINKNRAEGYVFAMKKLVNAHTQPHGENSLMFYLTMNVQETNCSVLSRKHFKHCEVLDFSSTPEYGQCKAAIFISRVNRVVRLYKYNCVVRPVAAAKVHLECPDCPSHSDKNSEEVLKIASQSVEKFNKNSGLSKYFQLLQVSRATASYIMGVGMMYHVQFTVQETSCPNPTQNPADCALMNCEFAHQGLCKASHLHGPPDPSGEAESVEVTCEIYEPQAAEEEKKLHNLEATTEHKHDHEHTHDHQHTHGGHSHAHPHNHDQAHDHSRDRPHQHHQYQHGTADSSHFHDHELALDHAHNHSHLHEHEHHHHHHHHQQQGSAAPARRPVGLWGTIPALGGPMTLPAFPDLPAGPEPGVTLPAPEDPQIPGQLEPSVGPFPSTRSADCPPAPVEEIDMVAAVLAEDPAFQLPA